MHAKFYSDQPNAKCLLQLTISIRKQCLPRKISVIRAGAWNFLCCRRTMRTADVSVFLLLHCDSQFFRLHFLRPILFLYSFRRWPSLSAQCQLKLAAATPAPWTAWTADVCFTTDISHMPKLCPITVMGR